MNEVPSSFGKDGEGVIIADITPGQVAGVLEPIPDSFWIRELPPGATGAWEYLNPLGRRYYDTTIRPILEGDSLAAQK